MGQGTAVLAPLSTLDAGVVEIIDRLTAMGDPDSLRSAERLSLQLAAQRRCA